MSERDASADLPVLAVQVGFTVGAVALGVASLVTVLAITDQRVAALRGTIIYALCIGMAIWLVSRRRLEFKRLNLTRVAGSGRRGTWSAVRRGLLMAVIAGVVEALAIGLLDWLWDGDSVRTLLPGLLCGLALWAALDTRDLRRFQSGSDLVVYTRTGAPLIAFTPRQSHDLQVVTSASAGPPKPLA